MVLLTGVAVVTMIVDMAFSRLRRRRAESAKARTAASSERRLGSSASVPGR
jgi:hypothetical protein